MRSSLTYSNKGVNFLNVIEFRFGVIQLIWFVIIAIVVICCIVAAFNESNEEAAKAIEAQNDKQIAAKRPDAFIRLFSEEFPDFAGQLTFSKSEEIIQCWERISVSSDFRKHFKLFSKDEFKSPSNEQTAMRYIMLNVANNVSSDFEEYVNDNLKGSYAAMRRAINSSKTLAAQ